MGYGREVDMWSLGVILYIMYVYATPSAIDTLRHSYVPTLIISKCPDSHPYSDIPAHSDSRLYIHLCTHGYGHSSIHTAMHTHSRAHTQAKRHFTLWTGQPSQAASNQYHNGKKSACACAAMHSCTMHTYMQAFRHTDIRIHPCARKITYMM